MKSGLLFAVLLAASIAAAQEDPAATPGTPLPIAEFAAFDSDGNGNLSREEVGDSTALSGRFDHIDSDRNGAISRLEFLSAAPPAIPNQRPVDSPQHRPKYSPPRLPPGTRTC